MENKPASLLVAPLGKTLTGIPSVELQILRDGFDSRLEPIAFDIYRVAADSKSGGSLHSLPQYCSILTNTWQ